MAPPCAIVIFGASGDLTARKLMPAVYELARSRSLPAAFRAAATQPTVCSPCVDRCPSSPP